MLGKYLEQEILNKMEIVKKRKYKNVDGKIIRIED